MEENPLPETTILWFREDLRIHDNSALTEASKPVDGVHLNIVGLFVIDLEELRDKGFGPKKVDFILRNLASLKKSLMAHNIPLLIRTVNKSADAPAVISELAMALNTVQVYCNDLITPRDRSKDEAVFGALEQIGIKMVTFFDQCVVHPGELIARSTKKPYLDFVRFKSHWQAWVNEKGVDVLSTASFLQPQRNGDFTLLASQVPKSLPGFELDEKEASIMKSIWPAGEDEALSRLESFLMRRSSGYTLLRDFPANGKVTSLLSPYLALGVISPRICVKDALKINDEKLNQGKMDMISWLTEMIWRDFYRQIAYFNPHISNGQALRLAAEDLPWRQNESEFTRWCEGMTGYPFVDAGMRQLNHYGWACHRVRQITSQFLTKHLLIDWRFGERFFLRQSIDADFCQNNGGWQWSAFTGPSNQISGVRFDPISQGKNFDHEGKWIRRFVPELRRCNKLEIHEPWMSITPIMNYPKPVVNHEVALARLAAFCKTLPFRVRG